MKPSWHDQASRRASGLNQAFRGYARSSPWNENVSRPLSLSQTLTVPLSHAATTDRPSGRKATPLTADGCAENSWSDCPLVTSHRRTLRSEPAEAIARLSGLNATCQTVPLCASNVCTNFPLLGSQTRTFPSLRAAARYSPLGL